MKIYVDIRQAKEIRMLYQGKVATWLLRIIVGFILIGIGCVPFAFAYWLIASV